MAVWKPIYLFLMLLITYVVSINVNAASMSDEEMTKLFIGSWTPDSKDKVSSYGIGEYKIDGTFEFILFQTSECKIPTMRGEGNWIIRNGNLIISSGNVPPSKAIIDKVISITSSEMVLKSADGDLQYRIKSNRCLKKY